MAKVMKMKRTKRPCGEWTAQRIQVEGARDSNSWEMDSKLMVISKCPMPCHLTLTPWEPARMEKFEYGNLDTCSALMFDRECQKYLEGE